MTRLTNANLNVHFQIPIAQRAGRGLSFSYQLGYDSSVWYPSTSGGTNAWTPVANWGWGAITQVVTGYVTYMATPESCTGPQGQGPYYWSVFSNFQYRDSFGIAHVMPFAISDWSSAWPCGGGPANSGSGATSDGSGYSMQANVSSGGAVSASSFDRSGKTINAPLLTGFGAGGSIYDSNGNEITAAYAGGTTSFTDTLGTTALTATGSGTVSSPLKFGYTNPQGGTSYYTVSVKPTPLE